MPKFTVRLTGTSPVWADIEVEAPTKEEAYEMVSEGAVEDYAQTADWELSEGGNGVDDWEAVDVYDEDGDPLMEDRKWLKDGDEDDKDEDDDDEEDDEEEDDDEENE